MTQQEIDNIKQLMQILHEEEYQYILHHKEDCKKLTIELADNSLEFDFYSIIQSQANISNVVNTLTTIMQCDMRIIPKSAPSAIKRPKVTLESNVFELNLSTRACKALRKNNIQTIKDLTDRTEHEIMRLKNVGPDSLLEIKSKLMDHGFALRVE